MLAHVSSFATRPARRDPIDALQAKLARRLHPYFQAKRVMEEEVLAASDRGVRVVVVNPTYCLGPWDLTDGPRALGPGLGPWTRCPRKRPQRPAKQAGPSGASRIEPGLLPGWLRKFRGQPSQIPTTFVK